ncbi:MAG: endolytic transglycosylase MltG [Balneolaceae bacterium]
MNHFSVKEFINLIIIFMMVVITTIGSRSMMLYGNRAIETDTSVDLFLYESTDLNGLSENLDSLGVKFNRERLIWAGNTLRWRTFVPGRYRIEGDLSHYDLLSKLARGLQDPVRVTVLPGLDIERLSRNLSMQLRADSLEFKSQFSDSSALALESGLSGEELFSRMLPDTYEMFWTSTPENSIRRLYREFQNAVTDRLSDDIEKHFFNLDEIIILASIVEWEARLEEEKPRISGLYLNRLTRNMMLQADPTVIYALGERRRLLFEDYGFDHPYNTYQIQGLPPGPITNPSLSSIRAVLEPEEHDYLFMVATPEGSHRFTRTFREHQEASEEWRRWLREQVRIRQQLDRLNEQENQ